MCLPVVSAVASYRGATETYHILRPGLADARGLRAGAPGELRSLPGL